MCTRTYDFKLLLKTTTVNNNHKTLENSSYQKIITKKNENLIKNQATMKYNTENAE